MSEEIHDALVRHQIGLIRVSGGVRNQVIAALDDAEADIQKELLNRSNNPTQLRRLLDEVREIRGNAWTVAAATLRNQAIAAAKAEPVFLANMLRLLTSEEFVTLDPSSRVRSSPIQGATINQWIADTRSRDLTRLDRTIRNGVFQKFSPRAISQSIFGTTRLQGSDGIFQKTRNNAATLTRTMMLGAVSLARRFFYDENTTLLAREQYIATLDGRTTAICRSLHGNVYNVGEGPNPPMHMNCRSIRIPLLTPGDAVDTTYDQFLRRQPVDVQDDILGTTKARLWRKGGLTLEKFVDRTGSELSLTELAKREREAFIKAGLNPKDF